MSQEASGLLEQIATAILLEETQNQNKENIQSAKYPLKSSGLLTDRFRSVSSDDAEESEEEFFEDGDEEDDEKINVKAETEKIVLPSFSISQHHNHINQQQQLQQQNHHQDTAAAVLTELSQATVPISDVTTKSSTSTPLNPPQIVPRGSLANPNMTATINSINAFLQSHLHTSSQQPHKVRLSGPIRANINIRHGVWAPRLRCRKRKNLHAKDGIWIHPDCTVENLVTLVKNVLPDEFDWDAQASPLRYQAVNDQSLQSLKTVSGTVAAGQSLYSAFDLVRNRRSDGDNFILQLFVYGTWTVLLKSLHLHSHINEDETNSNSMMMSSSMSSHMQPPPKKKYQQAHYHQMQMTLNGIGPNSMNSGNTNLITNENINQNHSSNSNNLLSQVLSHPSNSNNSHSLPQSNFYTHPLAANPPVTFLPTITLEMKMNGTFIPMEISRRSFIAAIRACSMPKPGVPSPPLVGNHSGNYISPSTSTSIHKDESSLSTTCSIPSTNSTPPPSES